MAEIIDPPISTLLAHGAEQLSAVTVDAYNAELRHADGFVGDRASKRAFRRLLMIGASVSARSGRIR